MTRLEPRVLAQRGRTRRKRFLVLAAAGLAVLAAALGVSFLGATGATTTGVTANNSNFVYPVASGGTLPSGTDFVSSLKNTTSTGVTSNSGAIVGTPTTPSWSPAVGAAGSVTAGDLALIDATTSNFAGGTSGHGVIVNVYVTNLADLQKAYSGFAFPFDIYKSQCAAGSCLPWGQASNVITSAPTYLTNTQGYLSFSLPAGYYYDITMDTGGSLYTTSTSLGSLSPSFYFTAQPY